jgi:hypothetical protein
MRGAAIEQAGAFPSRTTHAVQDDVFISNQEKGQNDVYFIYGGSTIIHTVFYRSST